jgi:hypothetical protein
MDDIIENIQRFCMEHTAMLRELHLELAKRSLLLSHLSVKQDKITLTLQVKCMQGKAIVQIEKESLHN